MASIFDHRLSTNLMNGIPFIPRQARNRSRSSAFAYCPTDFVNLPWLGENPNRGTASKDFVFLRLLVSRWVQEKNKKAAEPI
jgi:hypothetical protein